MGWDRVVAWGTSGWWQVGLVPLQPPALPLLQAKPWWRWIPATGQPRAAAPAPSATTGARTASAAAATPSARPASAPRPRVRSAPDPLPHPLPIHHSCPLQLGSSSRGQGGRHRKRALCPPAFPPAAWGGVDPAVGFCLSASQLSFMVWSSGPQLAAPTRDAGFTPGGARGGRCAGVQTQVGLCKARTPPADLSLTPHTQADTWCVCVRGNGWGV